MNNPFTLRRCVCALLAPMLAIIGAQAASAATTLSAAARIEPYLMASKQQEIALARTAAPPSISMHATVLVLTARGYVTAAKGSNGFVCLVTRSWDNAVSVQSARFWNPRTRVPYCFNAAGARSVLPEYLLKTRWALTGASRAQMSDREKSARAAGKMDASTAGAICYMMSKRSWGVGGNPGPWRPHLMLYYPRGHAPDWGANLTGSPVLAGPANDATTVVVVLVPVWSDGSPAPRMN